MPSSPTSPEPRRKLTKAAPPDDSFLAIKRFHGLTAELMRSGIPEREATPWSYARVAYDIPRMVELVIAWRRVAVDTLSAIRYCELGGWKPEEAEEWHLAGFAPHQADFAVQRILLNLIDSPEGTEAPADDELTWLRSGLMPSWICLVLAAGCRTVDAGRRLLARSSSEPTLLGSLELMAEINGVRNIRELMST